MGCRAWIAIVLPLAGCAGADTHRAPRPEKAEIAELVTAERLYRDEDPAFAAARDRLAKEPDAAFWLTRMLVDDLIRGLDAVRASDEAFLDTVAQPKSPLEGRALTELRALGPAAVPEITADLLHSGFSDRRQLGAEILAQLGPDVAAALEPLSHDDDWRVREALARAVADMPSGGDAVLQRALDDPHFAVRAAAVEGLARRGAFDRVRAILQHDADEYVRRKAAAALAADATPQTAEALVDYYAGGVDRNDRDAAAAAEASLRAISGERGRHDVAFWRDWLRRWRPEEGR